MVEKERNLNSAKVKGFHLNVIKVIGLREGRGYLPEPFLQIRTNFLELLDSIFIFYLRNGFFGKRNYRL